MKGSIFYQKDRKRFCVSFYMPGKKSPVKITRYKGELIYHESIAKKCLSMVQGDWEKHLEGVAEFRIEKYTGKNWTDVLEMYESWMHDVIEPSRKPATIKGYWSYYRIWIKPFFQKYPVRLHEVQLDTLIKLRLSIKASPKHQYNIINAFHSFMDYAWRSRRIQELPPFPKKEDYNLVEPSINWLSEVRQMDIINQIPTEHRPIFLWLKYHLRRPAEACALRVEDFDLFNSVFVIRRSVSARTLVESTKTRVEHIIPCHPAFLETAKEQFKKEIGSFFFQNRIARQPGKRYTGESLNRLWKKACKKAEEKIDLYSGLKHSSCSQYVNEKGLSISDLKEITDHARLESVRKYAKVSVSRKLELMSRTTTKLPQNILLIKN